MRLVLLVGSLAVMGFSLQQGVHPMVKRNVETLQAAQSMKLVLSVNEVGGVAEEQTLVLSKGGFLWWETPTIRIVADGTNVFRLNKTSKTYTETPQTESWKALLAEDVPWLWSALENPEFAKTISAVSDGSSRKVRTFPVLEVKATGPGKRPVTLLFDEKLGVFRGATFENMHGGAKIMVMVVATEITIADKPADLATFKFVPTGATKEVPKPVESLTFADVKPILDANCKSCHGPGGTAGVDVTSYASLSAGRRPNFVAGDPESSRIYRMVKTGKMPPGRSLPSAEISKIGDWIKQGAKE